MPSAAIFGPADTSRSVADELGSALGNPHTGSKPWNRNGNRNEFCTATACGRFAGAAAIAIPLAFGAISVTGTGPLAAAATVASNVGTGTVAGTPNGSFAPIVALVKPATVTITAKSRAAQMSMDGIPQGTPFDDFFRQFFDQQMQRGQRGAPAPRRQAMPQSESLGSGFVVGADGVIVTNNHVIDGASEISVTLDDGQTLPAKLVGRDEKTDIAVLRVKAQKKLPVIAWGNSEHLQPGDQILAIGNPFGVGTTVTSGIVSARGRDLHNGPYDDFIQVDAAINRGNSGGPLVDLDGHVVGINSAIYSPNGGNVGVGFAIPSDQAQKVVAKILEHGTIEHGYIGVRDRIGDQRNR